MPIKSSHRLNGFPTRECDKEEEISGKDEDEDDDSASEKEYLEKLHNLTGQLKQLNEGTHPELCKALKKAECWLSDQQLRFQILHEHKIDEIHCQYDREIKTCEQDCLTEKRKIREYLTSLCEDLKRRLEHDKKNIELTPTGDVLEMKPTVTRKLRRRTPETSSSATCSAVSKFGYWGDVLLYGSSWPKSSMMVKASLTGSDCPSVTTTTSPKPNETESSESAQLLPTPQSSLSSSGNLFGSLGVNVEDSSLITHLLASLNAACEVNGLSSSGAMFASALNQSVLSSLVSPSTTVGTGGVGGGVSSGSAGVGCGATVGVASAVSVAAAGASSVAAFMSSTLAVFPGASGAGGGFTPLQPSSKRRKQQNSQPFTQLSLLLPENDIYSDLTSIHRACGKPPSANCAKKHTGSFTSSSGGCGAGAVGLNVDTESPSSRGAASPSAFSRGSDAAGSGRDLGTPEASRRKESFDMNESQFNPSATPSVWIDDGRLYCGQTCFQKGALVYIEGHGCSGSIVAIGAQDVSIKRSTDHGIIRVTVQQLKQGRCALLPKR